MANSQRGLASADKSTRLRVSALGGKAAQRSGRAHSLSNDERSSGGKHSPGNFANRSKEEVERIGRRGGLASSSKRAAKKDQAKTDQQNYQTPTAIQQNFSGI